MNINSFPPKVQAKIQPYLNELSTQFSKHFSKHFTTPDDLIDVIAKSEFVAQLCLRQPQYLLTLLEQKRLYRCYKTDDIKSVLQQAVDSNDTIESVQQLQQQLRQQRQIEMLRIAWRDLQGLADLNETMRDLSLLAEACVNVVIKFLWQSLVQRYGEPQYNASLLVLGMGKLGAYELNFSSDIDLIYAFPYQGKTQGQGAMSHEEFFTRLARQLTQIINASCFRVDVRLRPYGESGPLVMSFGAMEAYYQAQAREWERYAMIKARVIAGDDKQGQQLMTILRPFVYRRYLDYGAFASLREMKGLIESEVKRRELKENIKLGSGGIREIEFIGQAFQLILGGKESALQQRGIQQVLSLLAEKQYLPEKVVAELLQAYQFLRRLENRLQAYLDQQTHRLPEDESIQARIAWAMGYKQWQALYQQLEQHRQAVAGHFQQIIAVSKQSNQMTDNFRKYHYLLALWEDCTDETQIAQMLSKAGLQQVVKVRQAIVNLKRSYAFRALSKQAYQRLTQLTPLLFGAIKRQEGAELSLIRILEFLEKIIRRSAYLMLLIENPNALSRLVNLSHVSPWIMHLLAYYPILLDELLDHRHLYSPQTRDSLEQELKQLFATMDMDDTEARMDKLHQFAQINWLRVAASDATGVYPLMVVSDYLTEIAEVVIQQVFDMAWRLLIKQYGQPCYKIDIDGEWQVAKFAIIAYGKLGGIELSYGSDLDLVFLHNSQGVLQQTLGDKCIDNSVFFTRLGRKIVYLLNIRTPSGILYEVDLRLRPNGASGLLVSSMEAFAYYQQKQAWTWEHQSLLRARAIVGEDDIQKNFSEIRQQTLQQMRDISKLQQDVKAMREKQYQQLANKQPEMFDLKHDRGGIAEIEFLVQYMVLSQAVNYPDLLKYTDNIRILETLEQLNLMPASETQTLIAIYKNYRAKVHEQLLQEQTALVDKKPYQQNKEKVMAIWQKYLDNEE